MSESNRDTAVFAGGCFWCTQAAFANEPGVISAISGYTGGHIHNPTYEQVCSGKSGHVEALLVTFDPKEVSYLRLLEIFWRNIDPLDAGGQFADRGSQYHTAVFYLSDAQHLEAEQSKIEMEKELNQNFATQILPAKTFYPAEDYHQDYYKTNKMRYQAYYYGSGRAVKLQAIWRDHKK